MADQDPYEQGAVWIHDSRRKVRILGVIGDEEGLIPLRRPDVYVITTPHLAGDSMPAVWTLDAFLLWHERPEGGQPPPKAFIPRQQDTDNRRAK